MKILNSDTLNVEIGDKIEYIHEAIEWINNYHKKMGEPTFPKASELNKKNPIVTKVEFSNKKQERTLFVWIHHDKEYTGLSGVVSGKKTDVWALYPDGKFDSRCQYSIFKIIKEK